MTADAVVYSTNVSVSVRLTSAQVDAVQKALNRTIAGREDVNEYTPDGRIVPRPFPPDVQARLQKATYNLHMSQLFVLHVDILDDGTWKVTP